MMMRPVGILFASGLLAFPAVAQNAVIESPITQEVLPLDDGDPEVIGVQTDGTTDPGLGDGFDTDTGGGFATDPDAEVEFGSPDWRDLGAFTQEVQVEEASVAEKGVLLRALDKISGDVVDFELTPNQTKQLGRIQVTLGECRFPVGNPAGDASAYLTIRNAGDDDAVFTGWMIASSPALNALDHSRYDVWVLRCITS